MPRGVKINPVGHILEDHAPFASQIAGELDVMELKLNAMKIVANSAKTWELGENYSIQQRITIDHNLCLVHSGKGSLITDVSRTNTISKGQVFYYPPNTLHVERFPKGAVITWVHFDLEGLVDENLTQAFGMPLIFRPKEDTWIGDQIDWLCREYQHRPPGWRSSMGTGIRAMIYRLVRTESEQFGRTGPSTGAQVHQGQLQPALDLVRDRWRDPALSISELATVVGVSEVRLRQLFVGKPIERQSCICNSLGFVKPVASLNDENIQLKRFLICVDFEIWHTFIGFSRNGWGSRPGLIVCTSGTPCERMQELELHL